MPSLGDTEDTWFKVPVHFISCIIKTSYEISSHMTCNVNIDDNALPDIFETVEKYIRNNNYEGVTLPVQPCRIDTLLIDDIIYIDTKTNCTLQPDNESVIETNITLREQTLYSGYIEAVIGVQYIIDNCCIYVTYVRVLELVLEEGTKLTHLDTYSSDELV